MIDTAMQIADKLFFVISMIFPHMGSFFTLSEVPVVNKDYLIELQLFVVLAVLLTFASTKLYLYSDHKSEAYDWALVLITLAGGLVMQTGFFVVGGDRYIIPALTALINVLLFVMGWRYLQKSSPKRRWSFLYAAPSRRRKT